MSSIDTLIKFCPYCKQDLPATTKYFAKCKNGKYGLRSYCKKCQKEYYKIYGKSPKGKKIARKAHLKSKFNITLEQYDKMLEKQNGVCAICGKPPIHRKLAIDHNHKTGKIRGLLCIRCNPMLGWHEKYYEKILKYFKDFT